MYGKRGAKLERKRDAHHQLVVELRRHLPDWRTFSTPRMPQSHHLHMFWRGDHMVVKVILDDRQIDPAYVRKPHVSGAASDARLRSNQRERAIQLLPHGIWSSRTVLTPPFFCFPNLPRRKVCNFDDKLGAHSRLRISRRSSFAEIVSPRCPCAIDSRSTASSSAPT